VVATKRAATRAAAATQPAVPAPTLAHRFLETLPRVGETCGVGREAPFVALTPRFRNSSHLVFLLFPDAGETPRVVAKVAREPGPSPALEEEARRLHAVQSLRSGGFTSIPRVLACATQEGHALLVETAVAGEAIDPGRVRAQPDRACRAVIEWLLEVQGASRRAGEPGGFEHAIQRDLAELESVGAVEGELVRITHARASLPAELEPPRVLEHGDLSHPNLLMDRDGRVAVLDWESAELQGIPGTDLFFFLAYVARARHRALAGAAAAAAVIEDLVRQPDWARPHVKRYAEALGVAPSALGRLFLACWVRQVAGLVRRTPKDRQGPSWLENDWRMQVWRQVAAADRTPWER
jgi:aminoglycoside phosphotransferase (APT) family kinase protein